MAFTISGGVLTKFTPESGETKVVVPEEVNAIGLFAFSYCDMITEIILPSGVKSIGNFAFGSCKSLRSVNIPESVETIGEMVFEGCSSLRCITIPEGVTTLNRRVFKDCSSLQSVVLPGTLTSIGESAFESCVALNGLQIPDGVTKIGKKAFLGCIRLTDLKKPAKKCKAAADAFKFCGFLDPSAAFTTDDVEAMLAVCSAFFPLPALLEFMQILPQEDESKEIIAIVKDRCHFTYGQIAEQFMLQPEYIAAFLFYFEDHFLEFPYEDMKKLYDMAVQIGDQAFQEKLIQADRTLDPNREADPTETEIIEKMQSDPALQVKGDDLSDFFKEKMQGIPVHYADSTAIAPVRILYFIYHSYLNSVKEPYYIDEYQKDDNNPVFCPLADKAAALLDEKEFDAFIEGLTLDESSSTKLLSIVPYCRYSKNEKKIQYFVSQMKAWKDWGCYGRTGRECIIIARGALMLSDTKAAYDLAEKEKRMYDYARLRGMDENTLRDSRLESYGLDENGEKVYDIGGNTIHIYLQDDLTFALYNEGAGKFVKSIPKRSDDPEKAAECAKDFSELKKAVKSLYKQRIKLLKEKFLTGKSRSAQAWEKSYLKNALLRKLAKLVVWECENGNTSTYFTIAGTTPILVDGSEFAIPPESEICVAHPVDMPAFEVIKWQQYFLTNSITQAFEQVWEPVMDLHNLKEKYVGMQIPFYLVLELINGDFTIDGFYNGMYGAELHSSYADIDVELPEQNRRRIYHLYEIDKDEMVKITHFSMCCNDRQKNHFVYMMDKRTVYGRILKNDAKLPELVQNAGLPQLCSYLDFAIEHGCTEATVLLLRIKHEKYPEYEEQELNFSLD